MLCFFDNSPCNRLDFRGGVRSNSNANALSGYNSSNGARYKYVCFRKYVWQSKKSSCIRCAIINCTFNWYSMGVAQSFALTLPDYFPGTIWLSAGTSITCLFLSTYKNFLGKFSTVPTILTIGINWDHTTIIASVRISPFGSFI